MTRSWIPIALFAIAIPVNCADQRHVRVLLGPTAESLSHGFLCMNESETGLLLGEQVGADRVLRVQLVVDIIDLGSHIPGCFFEQVEETCGPNSGGECRVSVADAPTRFCTPLAIAVDPTKDVGTQIADYLHAQDPTVVSDAPGKPVMVRAVLTTQSCDVVQKIAADGRNWVNLIPKTSGGVMQALGCAYSCPTNFDDVSGDVSLGIDVDKNASNDECLHAVQACAALAAVPQNNP